MVDGQQALNDKNRRDAISAFTAALKEKPGDPAATTGLKKAKALR